MSAEGSSVKGSSQQSSTSFPKVKGGGPLFSGPGPLITGGLVNDTTPVHCTASCSQRRADRYSSIERETVWAEEVELKCCILISRSFVIFVMKGK